MTLTLTRCDAAMLCGISVHTFDEWVSKGILPRPICGTRRWSRAAIEQALAGGLLRPGTENSQSAFEEWKQSKCALK
jgi:predicted DNA-binding transcriptional regulator AlpA